MKLAIAPVLVVIGLALLPAASQAKGCLKGAAVGAVGGHVAGHHGLIGAAAGCAVGRHMANKKDAANASNEPAGATPVTPAPAPTAAKP